MPDYNGICERKIEGGDPLVVKHYPITAANEEDALIQLSGLAAADGIDCDSMRVVEIPPGQTFVLSHSDLDGPDKLG